MEHNALETLAVWAVCVWLFYKLFVWSCDLQRRLETRYGTRKKTLLVNLVNMFLLYAWVYLGVASVTFFWCGLGYLGVGLVVLLPLGVPPAADLDRLDIVGRFWLRIFHAWFWPVYLFYVLARD